MLLHSPQPLALAPPDTMEIEISSIVILMSMYIFLAIFDKISVREKHLSEAIPQPLEFA